MEKRYIEVDKAKAEIIEPYRHAMFMISETLVEESKMHITTDDAIRKIREELRKIPSNICSRLMLEDVLVENSMTEKELIENFSEKYDSYLDKIANDCIELNAILSCLNSPITKEKSEKIESYLDKLENDCRKLNKDLSRPYFDFSANDDRVFIPKKSSTNNKKEKSCLVDHNKISKIKNAKSLDKYNSLRKDKDN